MLLLLLLLLLLLQYCVVVVARTRLQVGLSRLSEANDMVGTMQLELVTLGPRIEEKAMVSEQPWDRARGTYVVEQISSLQLASHSVSTLTLHLL